MPLAIEDYGLIGDSRTAALVGRDGSIDWLCLPRFDAPSIFAALLGTPEHGRWLIAPATTGPLEVERGYRGPTFLLETTFRTPTGSVRLTDLMPVGTEHPMLIRRVEGLSGSVAMAQELVLRFDYAAARPWVRRADGVILAAAGPDAVVFGGGPLPAAVDHRHRGEFLIEAGDRVDYTLAWYPSYRPRPALPDVDAALARTEQWWRSWAGRSDRGADPHERYARAVQRSLLVLRALSHLETGGIVAAVTTSLPEQFGGPRNWDYRHSWLRDAALTLEALVAHGYSAEAVAWRDWLLRAVAGDPEDLQIMYGVAGERNLPERELTWLPGYADSRPVRIGNGAVAQFQGDVIGEVMVALELSRRSGIPHPAHAWPLQLALLDRAEQTLGRPDCGIWEIRGEPRRFTHSAVMTWAAFDRGVRAVVDHGLPGPADRWRKLRDRLRAEIDEHGVDHDRGCFTQYFGGHGVDAALLQLPQVGFCAPDDPRMLATVEVIEAELINDGLVHRYRTEHGVDGLPPGENPFLACSFWLVEQYALTGRTADASALLDRLLGFANDLGLLSEEYDPAGGRQAGNTPQALSHLALVRAVDALTGHHPPVR
ncbi:MAG TPA: glycoside hydrolase family 15 protein [Microlunatus sp.]|nr:glycoside hydrolase family 15 protein [Microlunatus sp.]